MAAPTSPTARPAPCAWRRQARSGNTALYTERSHSRCPSGPCWRQSQSTKPARALFVEIAQTLFGCEVRQRVGDEQTPVLAAGSIVDGVVRTPTDVVIDRLQRVAVQGRAGSARGLLRSGADLDLTGRAKRGRRSPALPAILEIDGHPPRTARINARRRRALQRRRHLGPARRCHPGCHPGGSPRRQRTLGSPARTGDPVPRDLARPTGFEPVTFGSVADAVAPNLALTSQIQPPRSPKSRQKFRIAATIHRVEQLAGRAAWDAYSSS